MMKHVDSLQTLLNQYDVIFCDVWGVIHNGVKSFPDAVQALKNARRAGKIVLLLTNSPRPNAAVIQQLKELGINNDAYDWVVTSGDVTRDLIAEAARKIFHIGPERDIILYDGLNVELVNEFDAQTVVVTGLFDDMTETPADYHDMLQRFRSRDLPMICANPDIVVHLGNKELWCAGALARDYTTLGGRTFVSGKPHRPIYELAMRCAEKLRGEHIDKASILAIGDGILTDVKGAEQFDLDVLYISGGVHQNEYKKEKEIDPEALHAFIKSHGFHPIGVMEALQ